MRSIITSYLESNIMPLYFVANKIKWSQRNKLYGIKDIDLIIFKMVEERLE